MNRRQFLQRSLVAAIAARSLDFKGMGEALTELNPPTEVYRNGKLVASARFDEILKEYYLPPIREMLNSDSILMGKEIRVPLHFHGNSQTAWRRSDWRTDIGG
jgi:hypothetical protein